MSTSHITHKPCIHSPPLPFIRLEKSSISLFYSDRLPLLLPSLLRTLMHEMCVFIHLSSPLSLLLSFFFSFLLSSSQKNASQPFTYQHPLKILRTERPSPLSSPSFNSLPLPPSSLSASPAVVYCHVQRQRQSGEEGVERVRGKVRGAKWVDRIDVVSNKFINCLSQCGSSRCFLLSLTPSSDDE